MSAKFLIIDDGATERHLLSSMLRELGHEVDIAESTEGAMARIIAGGYRAIFLDIVMPNQDGYKFLRQLRTNPETANQYVIFSSTKRTKLEVEYGIKRGADDYLPKPISQESLNECLAKIL
ncbi:MAG: response regulator [Pseudanabaenaceae cyanobacterium bins.68]|nr:response regulator [Pseudanabaenaceae cyanobacterium bins.68]